MSFFPRLPGYARISRDRTALRIRAAETDEAADDGHAMGGRDRHRSTWLRFQSQEIDRFEVGLQVGALVE